MEKIESQIKLIRIGLVDNYDSFTYNLVHYLQGINCEVDVVRNNTILSQDISKWDAVVISPGPGIPEEAGELLPFLNTYYNRLPILGVCLGMQAIHVFFGGQLYNLNKVYHGEQQDVELLKHHPLFENCPSLFGVGLYHSWAVKKSKDLPLNILAQLKDGTIQAFAHKTLPIYGVQFHPESIMTEYGKQIIANFVAMVSLKKLTSTKF